MRHFTALLALFLLVGCSTPAPIDVTIACPPLRTWTPVEQAALAKALQPIPESSPIWLMSKDWLAMRDVIRACQKSNHHQEN